MTSDTSICIFVPARRVFATLRFIDTCIFRARDLSRHDVRLGSERSIIFEIIVYGEIIRVQ